MHSTSKLQESSRAGEPSGNLLIIFGLGAVYSGEVWMADEQLFIVYEHYIVL